MKKNKVISYLDLNNKQIKKLVKLRLINLKELKSNPTKIKVEGLKMSGCFCVISSKEFKNFTLFISFEKLYTNEFLYLQKLGIEILKPL